MRLSQKIGISSLLFFMIVYLTAGIGIIENNKKTAMNRILQLSADEQNSISSGIIKYVLVNRAKNNTGMNIDDSVYITEYLDSRINSWGIYLILLKAPFGEHPPGLKRFRPLWATEPRGLSAAQISFLPANKKPASHTQRPSKSRQLPVSMPSISRPFSFWASAPAAPGR